MAAKSEGVSGGVLSAQPPSRRAGAAAKHVQGLQRLVTDTLTREEMEWLRPWVAGLGEVLEAKLWEKVEWPSLRARARAGVDARPRARAWRRRSAS